MPQVTQTKKETSNAQTQVDEPEEFEAKLPARIANEGQESSGPSTSRRVPDLMQCNNPLSGSRDAAGRVKFTRTGSRAPDQAEAFAGHIQVPCGKCMGCRVERSRQWAIRMLHEAECHEKNSFITLTYDDDHLPDDYGLAVRDWQLFAKRLRKRCGKFRFYHCGEYGEQTLRPHGHAILFGIDFAEDREFKYRQRGHDYFVSDTLERAWGKGHCDITEVNYATCQYVAKYVTKRITGDQAEDHYWRRHPGTGIYHRVSPEYSTMSRGGRSGEKGIGWRWYEKWADQVYPRDEVIINGKAVKPPKYYDKFREKTHPEEAEARKEARKLKGLVYAEHQKPERLKVREAIMVHNAKRISREPGA